MRPSWVASQIRPVGVRCVDETGVTPDNGLAPGRDDSVHPLGHWIIRIGGKEIKVTLQRVTVQRLEIGLLRVKFTDRPCAQRRRLFRRSSKWRGIGGALEKHHRRLHARGVPGHLTTLRPFVYP